VAKFTKLYRQTEKPTPQTIHLHAKPLTLRPKKPFLTPPKRLKPDSNFSKLLFFFEQIDVV